jgi:hypothetical protein
MGCKDLALNRGWNTRGDNAYLGNRSLQSILSLVELKKRGVPFQPEELRPRLKLPATGKPGVVIFTRRGDERLMLIGERLA